MPRSAGRNDSPEYASPIAELFAYAASTTEETTDEDEVGRMQGDLLDLEPAIRDAIVLMLPTNPLCRPLPDRAAGARDLGRVAREWNEAGFRTSARDAASIDRRVHSRSCAAPGVEWWLHRARMS